MITLDVVGYISLIIYIYPMLRRLSNDVLQMCKLIDFLLKYRLKNLIMGGLFGCAFRSVCDELLIKQQFTPAQSPQYRNVAECRLGVVEAVAMVERIQAKIIFSFVQLPKTEKLSAKAVHWADKVLSHTTCTANPGDKSPNEMWFDAASQARLYSFLKPAYCGWKRPSKLFPKAESCFCLDPARDHLRDSLRVLTRGEDIIEVRNVTWEAKPLQLLPPRNRSLQKDFIETGKGRIGD